LLAVGGVAAASGMGAVAGGVAWRRATTEKVARLQRWADRRGGARDRDAFSRARLDGLPAPVARYLAFALSERQRRIQFARIRWTGEFQSRPGGGWGRFAAEQHFTVVPPGFVWDAKIQIKPLIPVRVRDSYIAGAATMLGRVAGLVPVVDEGDTAEIAASALVRWLGEAVWFPTALLPEEAPGEGVRWQAIDDTTARATLTDGATNVAAEFDFGPGGEITGMTAQRYRNVNGKGVLTPFEVRYRAYARRAGIMVPLSAEAAWLLPEGRYPYWRGQPADIAYELAAA
jgi:hypothetical protein